MCNTEVAGPLTVSCGLVKLGLKQIVHEYVVAINPRDFRGSGSGYIYFTSFRNLSRVASRSVAVSWPAARGYESGAAMQPAINPLNRSSAEVRTSVSLQIHQLKRSLEIRGTGNSSTGKS